MQWNALTAAGLANGKTAHGWFQQWIKAGVFHELWKTLQCALFSRAPAGEVSGLMANHSVTHFRSRADSFTLSSRYCR